MIRLADSLHKETHSNVHTSGVGLHLAAHILRFGQVKRSGTSCENKRMWSVLLALALLVLDKHTLLRGLAPDVMLHDPKLVPI